MHISDIEKMRMEKDHKMKHGYQIHDNTRYPHTEKVNEFQFLPKDEENKHARESKPSDYQLMMERGL